MKKITLIHTGFAIVDVLSKLFKQHIPNAELIHIVDDSLLREILANGVVTKPVVLRMINYFISAEHYKTDCILNVCSSVGEVADVARKIIATPIVKIDEIMAFKAVERSTDIGVVATLNSTLDPTIRMIEAKGLEIKKKINITSTVCPGAFEELMSGNPAKHDKMVLKCVNELSSKVDIIVFAQGSMARLVSSLSKPLSERILTSPESGVMEVKRILGV